MNDYKKIKIKEIDLSNCLIGSNGTILGMVGKSKTGPLTAVKSIMNIKVGDVVYYDDLPSTKYVVVDYGNNLMPMEILVDEITDLKTFTTKGEYKSSEKWLMSRHDILTRNYKINKIKNRVKNKI